MINKVILSVIIPTCHRNDLLALCLNKLAPEVQTLSSEWYEVIVTDDGSNSTAEQLMLKEYPWAKWVEGPRKGPASNRNNGALKANGKWLIFIDDDCIPDNDLIFSYRNAISTHPNKEVFEGRIYVDRQKNRFDEESPVNESGGYLWSCNFCIKRSLFEHLNGFDEGFPHASMEDVDFDYRLKSIGVMPLFLRNASVYHPWRVQQNMFRLTLKRFHSLRFFLEKHPEYYVQVNQACFALNIALSDLVYFVKNSFAFRFRGSVAIFTHSFLHVVFAFYFTFYYTKRFFVAKCFRL